MRVSDNLATLRFSDPDGTHSLPLRSAATTIGRSSDQDLILREAYVSRRHAVIHRLEEGAAMAYKIIDQNSSHGTYLNGIRIQCEFLKPGDVLQFGSLSAPDVRFELAMDDGNSSQSSLAGDLLSALAVFTNPAQQAQPASRSGGMERLNFLLNAARQLNAGGAITDIFRVLLQLSIQLTGVERGFVFLRREEDDEMHLALGLRADGTTVEEDSTVSRRAMQKAVESDSKFSVSDTFADNDAGAWVSVMANSIRSIYCLPLRRRISPSEPNRLLGLLYLDSQLGGGNLSEIDHQVLDTVATEAATLLHNALLAEAEMKARLAAEELAIAAKIHSGLMSMAMPSVPFAALAAKTVPCLAIGGDFYDAVALEDSVGVTVADVSGKGVPAAIVAATLQGIIHAQMLTGQGLPEIATLVNRFLCTRNVDKYATLVMLKLFPDGRVEYVNCGHVPPILVNAAGARPLEEGNMIVGLIASATYKAAHCKLAPGERILLVTDGITEAENSQGEQFGDASLNAIARNSNIDQIIGELAKFQGPNQAQDDWTLLDVRYKGQAD